MRVRGKGNMLNLIVGRTGVGKDYLANLFVEEGCRQLITYTTRPKRFAGEITHKFITEDQVDSIPNKIIETEIAGFKYFSTKEDVANSDVCIVDPNGAIELIKSLPDEPIHLIYVQALNSINSFKAMKRESDGARAEAIVNNRVQSEKERFDAFEKLIQPYTNPSAANNEQRKVFPPNVKAVTVYVNDYEPQKAKVFVTNILENNYQYSRGL